MRWTKDWTVGNWTTTMERFTNPSFSIPQVLSQRYASSGGTTMPAGPYVDTYDLKCQISQQRSQYGQFGADLSVDVRWKEAIHDAVEKRDQLFGGKDRRTEIDTFHSQLAVAFNWLMLNEMQKMINRTRAGIHAVDEYVSAMDPRWDELIQEVHQITHDAMRFDPIEIEKYVREHKSSVVIPRTMQYPSLKWSALNNEGLKYLCDLGKATLEFFLEDWDTRKHLISKPQYVGRGQRARGPDIKAIETQYNFTIETTRKVGSRPDMSTWFAFLPYEAKEKIYRRIKEVASTICGTEILLPAIEAGQYWRKLYDLGQKENTALVTGDGKNWEAFVTRITDVYFEGVNDGIPQLLSGVAMTSVLGTIASFMLAHARWGNLLSQCHALGALGDDLTLAMPRTIEDKFQDLPGVWEIDQIGTKYQCFLGIVMLKDAKGTFPGLHRITIDRADKKVPIKLNASYLNIGGAMTEDNFKLYHEIMTEGTLHQVPLLDVIAKTVKKAEWEYWVVDKMETLSLEGDTFVIIPEEDVVPDTPEELEEETGKWVGFEVKEDQDTYTTS